MQGGAPSATVAQAGGVLTAFPLSRAKQVSAAVISLYWKNVNGNWRIASFTVSADSAGSLEWRHTNFGFRNRSLTQARIDSCGSGQNLELLNQNF